MSSSADREIARPLPAALADVRARVDEELTAFLEGRRAELAAIAPPSEMLVAELQRLVAAGGKRIRPAFCYWGYRAAGGPDGDPIVRVAAAIELLHTFALVHDDVMDRTQLRRGVDSTHVRLARDRSRVPGAGDPEAFGIAAAILVGDLAMVLADRLFLSARFGSERLLTAAERFDRMRTEMAAGQLLDVAGAATDPDRARLVARLKTGSYTVLGPLEIGAILAGATAEQLASLSRFGLPLGEAFQLRDDVLDGDAGPEAAVRVDALVRQSLSRLDPSVLDPGAAAALTELAGLLVLGGG